MCGKSVYIKSKNIFMQKLEFKSNAQSWIEFLQLDKNFIWPYLININNANIKFAVK